MPTGLRSNQSSSLAARAVGPLPRHVFGGAVLQDGEIARTAVVVDPLAPGGAVPALAPVGVHEATLDQPRRLAHLRHRAGLRTVGEVHLTVFQRLQLDRVAADQLLGREAGEVGKRLVDLHQAVIAVLHTGRKRRFPEEPHQLVRQRRGLRRARRFTRQSQRPTLAFERRERHAAACAVGEREAVGEGGWRRVEARHALAQHLQDGLDQGLAELRLQGLKRSALRGVQPPLRCGIGVVDAGAAVEDEDCVGQGVQEETQGLGIEHGDGVYAGFFYCVAACRVSPRRASHFGVRITSLREVSEPRCANICRAK
ncbi:hypothetical protein LRS03_10475 [Rhizobacter sp. J219]|nr:hypothetical protein [Rhizobacter sp. J219]MCR5883254.1 hypothetical protein [Rhizobacter sp. J219]